MTFPDVFIGLFTHDPDAHRLGVPYLRVVTACLLFSGVEIVTAESIMGSGHTAAISWIFGTFSVLRIPLAFLVPRWTGSGVLGIAWVITLTCIARSLLILGWARRGTWKGGLGTQLHGRGPPPHDPSEVA
ncbi:MAG: hypothetical protein A2V63_07105 [Candidatus Eisenbacteria bacterium RBG_19FT_COMBO_70_11]|nr:MAG: hypothetical protein A2V63_07105 [Candidatus Eisenbacteria bacterium RBG_19FT_COMBO_70_11]